MDAIVYLIQVTIYFTLIIPVRFFFRPQVQFSIQPEHIKKGTVFVANHQSRLDVFLIFLSLPPHVFLRLLPIYGLVAQIYMDTWWKKIALTCFGTYPVKGGKVGAVAALLYCLEKINIGHTLLLFPEGKVVKNPAISKAYAGLGYLAKSKPIKLLPVFLAGFNGVHFWSMIFRRHRACVVFGRLHSYDGSRESPVDISRNLLQYIYLTLPKFI